MSNRDTLIQLRNAGDVAEHEPMPTSQGVDGEEVFFTNIVCELLHTKHCECTQYDKRSELVPHCVTLTKENLKDITFILLQNHKS